MRFGIHIRTAHGLAAGLRKAGELGCEAAQLFCGNPNGWRHKPLDPAEAERFREAASELSIGPIVVHTPYLLNLAAPDDDIWEKSVAALADACTRADMLGADFVVTHIGSHKGAGYDFGIRRIADAVLRAISHDPKSLVCLELGAGAGNTIGSRFSEIADIFALLSEQTNRFAYCIDAAHLYAAGYDISTESGVENLFAEIGRTVGIERLKVAHLNDTLQGLGSHRDRHHHIGQGNIGIEGFRAIINHPALADTPGIIETPGDDTHSADRTNLDALRSLRQ